MLDMLLLVFWVLLLVCSSGGVARVDVWLAFSSSSASVADLLQVWMSSSE